MSTASDGRRVGSRLGPYEIVSRVGAGGMGEVYRGRDPRLGRDVALKILSGEVGADRQKLHRFEREARVVSALSHPNIVTVYEIGESDSVSYIAMELVEGQTLRQMLRAGGLPIRKLLDLATQIAEGLARAHEAGVVHRDLKPDNVMVTTSGVVKILDFGLAKLTRSFLERGAEPDDGTLPLPTEPGVLLGTVRYMSPEQATGLAADYRSDQFSFGSLLYELATGESAFQKGTTVDTLSAILHDEPAPIAQLNPKIPVPLRWIIERCLAKDPKGRYASTEDLARDLQSVRAHLSEVSGPGETPSPLASPSRRRWIRGAALAGALAVAVAAGAAIDRRIRAVAPPVFRQLTFRSGVALSAAFAPDEETVLYSALWERRPMEIFLQRIGSPESRPLGLRADLLSISQAGELALLLNPHGLQAWIDVGTLARMELASDAAPRILMEDVQYASWSPDGRELAIIREVGGRSTLEYPIGTVLYQETGGFLSHPRVSRDGKRIAFLDHPVRGDDAGYVAVVDRQGRKTALAEGFLSVFGLAWSPGGDEVWFTGTRIGTNRALQAVTMSGRLRVLARAFGSMRLNDVGRSGKVLLTHEQRKQHVLVLAPGEAAERELSWLDYSLGRAISPDGKKILFVEGGEGAGPTYAVFLRGTDGAAATRLGDGDAQALSPDGKWALAIVQSPGGPRLAIYPTGAGQPRVLPATGLDIQRADWMPDGKRMLLSAARAGQGTRLYLQSVDGGDPTPVSPEGYSASLGTISPDGKSVALTGPTGRMVTFSLEDGSSKPLPTVPPGAFACGWSADGRKLYVAMPAVVPASGNGPPGARTVDLVDVESGEHTAWKTLGSEDGAAAIHITPDGRSYMYSFVHTQADLYLVDELK